MFVWIVINICCFLFFVDFSLCLCGRRVGSFFQTLDEFLGDVQSDGKSPARLALLLP